MADKKLILVITAKQPYILNINKSEDFTAQNDILFTAITETYLPLLEMLGRLENENIPCKIGLSLSPLICDLLDNMTIRKQYTTYLQKRIDLGKKELERAKDNPNQKETAQSILNSLEHKKKLFNETYEGKLIRAFRHFAENEMIEFIPTAATGAYLPHYADLTEAVNAQIEIGRHANRVSFGDSGEGFYLPYMGWSPSFDRILRSYGINYTILDAKALLFADSQPEKGIFAPVRTQNSLVIFGSDHDTPLDIAGEEGYMHKSAYRCEQRDVGFELSAAELSDFLGSCPVRVQTGYRYWAIGDDGEGKEPYDAEKAMRQAKEDAENFCAKKEEKLNEALKYMDGEAPLLLCNIPAELLGQTWHEGIIWLEQVIRKIAADGKMELSHCRDNLKNQFSLQKITPYPCSNCGNGYGEPLLDGSNNWMMRYVRKATERMIDLAERFPSETGLKGRLLNIGAKEVLLAQTGGWPEMIQEGTMPDFAAQEFKNNIMSFSTVFDALASNTVSTEWLTGLEKKHPLFSWINYKVFSRKK